jgi:hypothetical protein
VSVLSSADIHGRTVTHLRSSGALARLCLPTPGIRDCAPSLQPSEQVLLFEEQFKDRRSEEDVSVEGFEIIDSHFDDEPSSARGSRSTATPSTTSTKVPPHHEPIHEPAVSLAAEASMHHAGPLSDSVGEAALDHVPSENKESATGAAASVLVAPLPAESSNSKSSGGASSGGIDFDAVSRRLTEASARRRATVAALKPYEGKHLVVFCHGYQGSSWDMRLFKNHVALLHPHVQVHASTANENQTEGSQSLRRYSCCCIHADAISHLLTSACMLSVACFCRQISRTWVVVWP